MAICKKGHRYAEIFVNLNESQADDGRHKCAGCAYEQGLFDALNNREILFDETILMLDASQAGTVRHKDPEEAYILGYSHGKRIFSGEVN